MNHSLVWQPVLGTSASTKQNPPIKKEEATISPEADSLDINNGTNAPRNISLINDSERVSLEQAAITAQAAIRGYQVFSCSDIILLIGIYYTVRSIKSLAHVAGGID